MTDYISNINVGFSLADSELESYFYSSKENKLILEINLWNEQIAIFSFTHPILHIDHYCNVITNLCENSGKNQLIDDALKITYEIIPKDHPYKLYQFLDLDGSPCIEIIAKKLDFKMKGERK